MTIIRNVILVLFMISLAHSVPAQSMQSTVIKAVSKTETGRKIVKVPEKWAKRQLKKMGVPESYVTTTIIIAKPLIDGKISTKDLKTGWKTSKNSVIRPDFEYNFTEGTTSGYVNWRVDF